LILSPFIAKKKTKLCNFQILSSLVAPPSLLHKKSNARKHLQTFSYPTVPNLFLNFNSMLIWRSETCLSKSVTDKKNIELFAPLAACEVQAPPNLAW